MSLRKLYVIVYALPHNARVWANMRGDEDLRRWGESEHLLANLQDMIGMLYRLSWIGHQIKGKPPTFDPVDRPGAEKATGAELMDPEAIAYLDMFSPGAEVQPVVVPEASEQNLLAEYHTDIRPGRQMKPKTSGA